MCGIAGTINPSGVHLNLETERIATLKHRGPDAVGTTRVDLKWARVAAGTARLAICDAQPYAVPAFYPSCKVLVAYNGEVYNWRELREELSDGTPWQSQTDTEVVARAWRRWGPAMLSKLNGMFALALFDMEKGEVLLARDRAGEKPFYYTIQDRGARKPSLHFASEIKALPLDFIETPCAEVDVLEFDCLEATPFQGVSRLPPGTFVHLKGPEDIRDFKVQQWWTLPDEIDESMTWDEAIEQTKELLVDSIRLRADIEVPWTVLVSGGLDSAIIQAVAKADRVTCCTFAKEGIDTMPLARLAAGDAEITPVTFGLSDVTDDLDRVAYHLDTPATWSALGHWFMAKHNHEQGFKVVLTGEGADELFAGYTRYRVLWHFEQAKQDRQLANYQAMFSLLLGDRHELLAKLLDRSIDGKHRDHANRLVRRFAGANTDTVVGMCRVDWHTTMQVLLRMADTMMSAFSLENRSPFLDYRLIELATRIPTRFKIDAQNSKVVLREVARRLGVPEAIILDRDKRGLIVPWNDWTSESANTTRGKYDRRGFADAMHAAWRRAWSLKEAAA